MKTPRVRPPRRRYEANERSREKPPLDARVRFWLPAIVGGGVGLVWVVWVRLPIWIVPLLAAFTMVVVHLFTGGAAWLVGEGTLGTSGGTTPYRRGFSKAEALAMRGEYVDAVAAYEASIAEGPDDPEPYLRIARLYKKEMGRPDDAAFWMRRARRDASVSPGQDLAMSRELIELYLASDDPRRAIPELARIVERYADTPEQAWAEAMLAELRTRDP